jgi:hypothetical protein
MGRSRPYNHNNYWNVRNKQDTSFYFSIHRARVVDVQIQQGTVSVELEGHPTSRKVLFPLLGLSMPPKQGEDDKFYKKSSWGRYIPQKNDFILVAFDSNGDLHSLGYSAVYYDGFGIYEDQNEDKGGIGWDEVSGKNLKPGDWDFKSARDCNLYLGNKAFIKSGPLNTTWDKSLNEVSTKSGLIKENFGEASESRRGVARRKILPTDAEETEIISLRGTTAQELTNVVNFSMLGAPVELARHSMGDVIDEMTKQLKVGTAAGQPVRIYEACNDTTGFLTVHEKEIDVLGNVKELSLQATIYQWDTLLANWTINNLTTTINSTTSMTFTTPSCVVNSANIQLGSPAAVSFALKGTEFVSAMNTFLTTMIATCTTAAAVVSAGDIVKLAAAWGTLGTQFGVLQANLASMLAKKVKVE